MPAVYISILACAGYDSPLEFEDITPTDIQEIERFICENNKKFLKGGLLQEENLKIWNIADLDNFKFNPGLVKKIIGIGQWIKKLGPQKFMQTSDEQLATIPEDKDARKVCDQVIMYYKSNYDYDMSQQFLQANVKVNRDNIGISAIITCPFCTVTRKILKDERTNDAWMITNFISHFQDTHKNTVIGNREKKRKMKATNSEKTSKKLKKSALKTSTTANVCEIIDLQNAEIIYNVTGQQNNSNTVNFEIIDVLESPAGPSNNNTDSSKN